MGQYQQWLHYREIDQQLHAELEALEAQLADLQERACQIEQTLPQANNQIISVLATMLKEQTTLANRTRANEPIVEVSLEEVEYWVENESADALPLQPALAAWGNLPNFDTPDMPIQPATLQGETPTKNSSPPQTLSLTFSDREKALPPIPLPEPGLLPEDMAAIFEEHSSTEPQIEPPWWLHTMPATRGINLSGPTDQESARTNRLVQRWQERWGRHYSQQKKLGEDPPHE